MGKWLCLPREVWCLRQGPLLTAMDWQADEYLLDKVLCTIKGIKNHENVCFRLFVEYTTLFFHNLAINTIIKMKNYEKNYSQIELERRRAWHGKHFITFFHLLWSSPKQKAINLAKTDFIRFVFVLHQWQVSTINYHCSFLTVFHRPRPVFDCFFFSFLLFLTKEKETKRRRKENRQNDFMLRDLCICQWIFSFNFMHIWILRVQLEKQYEQLIHKTKSKTRTTKR